MPYGTINADVIGTSVAGSNLGAGNASIMKNRIINGDMRIDQRNAGASVTPAVNSYTLDRWRYSASQASKVTTQQNAGSIASPTGFSNYLGVTSSSSYSIISSDFFDLRQYIEGYNVADLGWGTANAKTITLSFWVRSSLTGTFGGGVKNATSDRSYPFSYTISSANTWEQKTISIAGDTTGTWLTTNGIGITVSFSLGTGSTLSGTAGAWSAGNFISATGATSVVGTSGATFYITGIQLEVGSSATGFEYRQYGQELALCQRYYYKIGTGTSVFGSAFNSTTTVARAIVQFPVTMRTNPTALEQSGTATDYQVFHGNATQTTCSSVPVFSTGEPSNVAVNFTVASGLTAGQGSFIRAAVPANAYLGFSAEL